MADLQPLGSEKLQGMDKINRILEIARFKENTPNPINETSKNEYRLTLADNNEYQIVKEKSGYIIKKTISESVTDYIEPMKNRRYFSSYSQALKRLNLMAREMNELHENKEGISLFSEQKKFVLKTPRPEKKNPESDIENVPPPPPAAPSAPAAVAPPPPPGGDDMPPPPPPSDDMGDMPPPPPGEEGGDDMPPPPPPSEDEGDEMGGEDHEEGGVTFKTIQKLTGKLGQKLRALESQGDEPMSSKDVKYVINSILSALNLDSLEEDDKEEIMNKFEGEDMEDEGMGSEDMGDEDMSDDIIGTEDSESSEDEMQPEGGEMGESWADLGFNIGAQRIAQGVTPGHFKEEEDMDNPHHHISRIADEMFVENKVENILSNYFVITESEKKFNREVNAERKIVKKITTKEIEKEIKRLSESVKQEVSSIKFFKEREGVKLVGKTNKNNLIFEIKNKQFKISPEGRII